jgi:ubiquinone/menaquinone biosynthesis C-methylase UbiE
LNTHLPFHRTKSGADYGQDVPYIAAGALVFGIVAVGLGVGLIITFGTTLSILGWIGLLAMILTGILALTMSGFIFWSSQIGKLKMRDKVIDNMNWRGDEMVLDVGCGRGLLLIAAAKQLTTGKATGIDLWRGNIETNNSSEMVWANAHAEGVADRIDVKDGNARQLPFPNESFDVITSSFMLHHMNSTGRREAISEMARVLKPGGRLVVVEIAHTGHYVPLLQCSGLDSVTEQGLGLPLYGQLSARKQE